VEQYIGSLA